MLMSQKFRSHAEISKLHGDSSAFESDDFVPYLEQMNDQVQNRKIELTKREASLLAGIQTKSAETRDIFARNLASAF
jgi:hypothetical protein